MIRFSLLHPSRDRQEMAARTIGEWMDNASGAHHYEYLLSIDDDDDAAGYGRLASQRGVRLLVNRNRSVVDAVNAAAKVATGEVLIVVSDDFGCPPRWDEALAQAMGERRDVAVLVHDGVEGRILTLPVVGRTLYEALGWIYHPAYVSLFCDDDLTQAAAVRGKLLDARHLVFPHRHYSTGHGVMDATYARENSHHAWWHGWRTFEKRRLEEFGLRPRTPAVRTGQLAVDLRYYVRVTGSRVKRLLRGLRP
jgi:glycosyltransferase involved in cell wall biosynthesis